MSTIKVAGSRVIGSHKDRIFVTVGDTTYDATRPIFDALFALTGLGFKKLVGFAGWGDADAARHLVELYRLVAVEQAR